jgi:hypothetical protein
VIDLIHAGQLHEAAHRFPEDYSEVIDGHVRLAMVYRKLPHQADSS